MRALVTDEENVIGNKVTTVHVFDGPYADHERGRYGIDACIPDDDAHCDGCDCTGGSK